MLRDGETFANYRERFFREISKWTRVLDASEYENVYQRLFEVFGVQSPAYLDIGSRDIAISNDVPDTDYCGCFITHEIWELYAMSKPGYSFFEAECEDNRKPINQWKRPAHKFATFMEFQEAKSMRKLDDYFAWWESFYAKNIESTEQLPETQFQNIRRSYRLGDNEDPIIHIKDFIKSNWVLKREVYKKVRDSPVTKSPNPIEVSVA